MTNDGTRERRRARRLRWLAAAGVVLLRLLASTWRVRWHNRAILRDMRAAGRPVVLVLWHGDLLPLLWAFRHEGVAVLISEHGDGEVVARAALALGHRTVRGSTSRGGGRALLELCRTLDAGHDVAITPDGPRGPARTFAPGALIVAQRTGAPIVPLGAAATRAWRLRSWDGFQIPKPFSRVTVVVTEPVTVAAGTARAALAEAPRFAARLDEADRQAARG